MTTDKLLAARLAAANPVPALSADTLAVSAAHDELFQALQRQQPPTRRAVPRRSARRRRTPLAITAAIACLAAVAAVVLQPEGERLLPPQAERSGGAAWAAELVRFAEASPLLLLDVPGWKVTYVDERSPTDGEMRFVHARRGARAGGAALHWRPGPLKEWVSDRAASAELTSSAPVLGRTARVFQYRGGRPGRREVTALWSLDGQVVEFRSGVEDIAAFKVRLAALRRVSVDAWLSALPASAVKGVDQPSAVKGMLEGIVWPPGFDADQIAVDGLSKDRYQLGARVAGTVACTWFARWSTARRTGDERGERAAVTAMATAGDWPILEEMAKTGDYPQVLEDFAKAMPSGRWAGRPLEGDVDSALGCQQWSVEVGASSPGG